MNFFGTCGIESSVGGHYDMEPEPGPDRHGDHDRASDSPGVRIRTEAQVLPRSVMIAWGSSRQQCLESLPIL